MRARGEMAAEVLPPRSDIDAGNLQSREQRYRADLILRVVVRDSPAVTVVELQHLPVAPLAEIEQSPVPPNVGEHERVQIGPRIRHLLEKLRSLVDSPARQEYVRQRVLRPGLLAPHSEGQSRLRLRLVQ